MIAIPDIRRSTYLARLGRLLIFGLIVGLGLPANAGPERLEPLLRALELRAYASPARPPGFSGNTLDGRDVSLARLRGKVVIVNFWASWCVECRSEMPDLERLHRARAGQGLVIVGVNAREPAQAIQRYAGELGVTFPLVLDPAGTINTLYGIVGLPTTFLIGRDGRAIALGVGPRNWGSASAHALIEELMSEPAPTPGTP